MPASPPAAFITATLTASTRLIWPAPTAASRAARAKTTAFDFTWAQTRQASRRAAHSASVGGRRVTTRRPESDPRAAAAVHGAAASVTRSAPCTRRAPRMERTSRSGPAPAGEQSASTSRRFFFAARTARAPSSASGATTASTKVDAIASAVAPSTGRFNPTMPPNADSGSTSRAAT